MADCALDLESILQITKPPFYNRKRGFLLSLFFINGILLQQEHVKKNPHRYEKQTRKDHCFEIFPVFLNQQQVHRISYKYQGQ